jgi:peptidoglycan hydrolase-like protein with peptidoglycan-binding domain
MLVACISYYDQSIPHAVNTLLGDNCTGFFSKLGGALPNLLTPQAQAGQGATQNSGGAKTTSAAAKNDPIILLVQKKLNSLSSSKIKMKADGINGPQTDQALATFQKDKKIPDDNPNDATLKALFQ